jgi:Flp pilus assembly pilin Flp
MISLLPSSMKRVLRDRKGVSATEYVLMIVGIAAAVAGGATILGNNLSSAMSSIGSYVSGQAAKI